MKIRKRLILSILIITIFVASAILSKTSSVSAEETSNGYHIEEVISDKFNKENLDSSWTLNGSTVEHYYNALHCMSPIPYGYGPVFSGAKLSDKTRYEFTIHPQTIQDGANISFNIGMPNVSSHQNETTVDCKVQFWGSMLTFVVYQNNLILPSLITSKELQITSVNLYDAETDVAVVVERVNNRLTQVYCEYHRNGTLVYSSESSPFELSDPRNPNGYSGFFWDCLEMDINNVKVYNNDELAYSDDFSTNKVTFGSQDPSLGDIHVTGLNETNCFFANINSIRMDSEKESITNSYKLETQENVSYPYEMTYAIKINELNEGSFVGFGFGLKDGEADISTANAIGFMKSDENNAEVVLVKNGVVDKSNNYQIGLLKLGIGKYQTYTLTLDYANNAYLTVGDVTYKFPNIDYSGNFGVGVININSTASSNIDLNEFKLMTNTYKKYSSNDVSNDLNGRKLADDGFAEEPYINTQKYFIGPAATLEEDWGTGLASVVFRNAGTYSAFGVRERYSEWILEFDLTIDGRQNFNYIGVSFGRESMVDTLVTASTTNKAFLFRCDNNGASTEQVLWGSGCLFENGASSQTSPINIYDKDNTKYHVMFIAKNRSLYVYYKDINAPQSDMGILRAYVPNINIDGYVAIVGNNGGSFSISNYKMVNLSDECKEESNLTVRESFISKNTVSEKLTLDSVSKVKDGKLELNNSSINTVIPYLYEIVRFTTYELNDSLLVQFSNGKKLMIDAINNEMVVIEDDEETRFDVSEANLKKIKGKRFEITIIGSTIKVGYKGYYDPEDKMSAELLSYTFKTALSKDNIMLSANGKAVIDDLYVFALDNSMKCETKNYEDDPNNANIWEVREDYEEAVKNKALNEAKGCNSSIASMSFVLNVKRALLKIRLPF